MMKPFTSHHVSVAIRVRSSPVKKSLLLKAGNQLAEWNRSSYEFARGALFSTLNDSTTASTKPTLDDSLTVIALPLLRKPLLPGFFMPLYVKDPKILAALQESKSGQTPYAGAFLMKDTDGVTDSSSTVETVNILEKFKGKELFNKIHQIGALAQILSIKGEQVILIGRRRLQITEMVREDPLNVKTNHLEDKPYGKKDKVIKAKYFETFSTLKDVIKTTSLWEEQVEKYTQDIGDSTYQQLAEYLLSKRRKMLTNFGAKIFGNIESNYQKLADFGAGISGASKHKLQEILEEQYVHKRLDLTLELVKKQAEVNKIQVFHASIFPKPAAKTDKDKKESGSATHRGKTKLSDEFRKRTDTNKDKIPKHVLKVIEEHIAKLDRKEDDCGSTDDTYSYLEWLTVLPWGKCSDDNFDVLRAGKILDKDHYGLADVKERILEFIAVGTLRGNPEGKIICLSGPPGVGKTSIARSIASALGRKFFRLSLGGISDVSDIKGDRQVYTCAMPGKMVQCLKEVGTENPLVLLDELDKLGKNSEDDPANALLELLDPEQNANFLDLFLDVTIDLSKVLFVCAANEIDRIPDPLLDRMEVIDLTGYTTEEKMHIARNYLVKKVCGKCGLKPEQVDVSEAALLSLVENYCREAGVRNLQMHIEKIFRKIALKFVRKRGSTVVECAAGGASTEATSERVTEKYTIDESNLADYVGIPVFSGEKMYEQTPVGVVMGLAWTSMGGSTSYIETTVVEEREGKGGLRTTGQLGDVMKESAEIAHTVARRIMLEKEPESLFFANSKLHLHVPEGATPKDGPSAGCTMITSLLSVAMKKPVRKDLAMTGEVTLTGKILPIGGLKEKTMAARRSQVKVIIVPLANRRDFEELPESLKEGFNVHFVDEYEQIFKLAFGYDH